jgi:hypothetical protein
VALFEFSRNSFLRPRERLYELLTLQRAQSGAGIDLDVESDGMMNSRMIAGYVRRLAERGYLVESIAQGRPTFALTVTGRRRLQYLLVDFVNELTTVREHARALFRESLVPLALDQLRRVALYPASETAEAVFPALDPLGFELVAVVDDSPQKWGGMFHGHRVQPPAVLKDMKLDVVLVATVVFQEQIVRKIGELPLPGVRVHVL